MSPSVACKAATTFNVAEKRRRGGGGRGGKKRGTYLSAVWLSTGIFFTHFRMKGRGGGRRWKTSRVAMSLVAIHLKGKGEKGKKEEGRVKEKKKRPGAVWWQNVILFIQRGKGKGGRKRRKREMVRNREEKAAYLRPGALSNCTFSLFVKKEKKRKREEEEGRDWKVIPPANLTLRERGKGEGGREGGKRGEPVALLSLLRN